MKTCDFPWYKINNRYIIYSQISTFPIRMRFWEPKNGNIDILYIYTYLKFNICPEHLPSQKERIVCQLSFFSWHSLVFRIYLEKRYTYKYDDLGRETPPKFYSRPGLEVTFLAVTGDSESQTFIHPTRFLGGVKRLRLRVWNCRFKSSVPNTHTKRVFLGPKVTLCTRATKPSECI